jgi:cytochrome P450
MSTAAQPWRCTNTGAWMVESYALVQEVLANPETYSNKVSLTQLDPKFPAAEVDAIYRAGGVVWTRTLQTNDPPSHRRFRALVERVFTPLKVNEATPAIESAATELLAKWPTDTAFDAMAGYAVPLPLRIIAEQLGVPAADYRDFKRWSDAALHAIGLGASPEQHMQAAHCGVEFQRYFQARLLDANLLPEHSLTARIARAAQQPEFALTLPEQLSLLHTLMIAGHETTTSTLGSLLLAIARDPALGHAARADEKVRRSLIEEVLRLHAPVQGLFRITTQEVVLGGQAIPARSTICIRLGAANRDAARFAAAEQMSLDSASAQHLAFGQGIHHCIGASLARRELGIALAAVLERFDTLALAPGAEPLHYVESIMTRGLRELPLIGRAR